MAEAVIAGGLYWAEAYGRRLLRIGGYWAEAYGRRPMGGGLWTEVNKRRYLLYYPYLLKQGILLLGLPHRFALRHESLEGIGIGSCKQPAPAPRSMPFCLAPYSRTPAGRPAGARRAYPAHHLGVVVSCRGSQKSTLDTFTYAETDRWESQLT